MLLALMSRPSDSTPLTSRPSRARRLALATAAAVVSLVAAGCGSGVGDGGIQLTQSDPLYEGAEIFNMRCAGCHTLDAAGAEGSSTNISSVEYKDGPNFNERKEEYADVIYAIQNGGFSSGPMPQNIVTGPEAEIVACFVATYSGRVAERQPQPGAPGPTGAGDDDCRQQYASK